ncbi:hypothetical protein AGMMS49579_23170 [Spirochaetia bacterium]|nr:hypothetical protein AGMMS49579_23170 [Spirochaetia bacterium]
MKKFQISRALIGLFVVLAVGIGLAACDVGDYENLAKDDADDTSTTTLSIKAGNEWEITQTPSSKKASGTYEIKGQTYVFTVKKTDAGFVFYPDSSVLTVGDKFTGQKAGNSFIIGSQFYTKSAADEGIVVQLEFADDAARSEFDAE